MNNNFHFIIYLVFMKKYYIFLIFISIFAVSIFAVHVFYFGRNLASGGGMYHTPPEFIKSGKVTVLVEKDVVYKESRIELSKRFTDFICYYRFFPDLKFNIIPGVVISQNRKEIEVEYTIPSKRLSPNQKLEYYFKSKFDGHENTTNLYIVSQNEGAIDCDK